MIASGQTWRLSEVASTLPGGGVSAPGAFKASAPCAANPNDPCCVSCGTFPTSVCGSITDVDGQTAPEGCETRRYASATDLAQAGSVEPSPDNVNLRCFEQKRRFGVDYLYPIERYANALTQATICPSAVDLDPAGCEDPAEVIPNPLFAARAPSDVIIANLVGVPWQDLAVDPAAASLELRASSDLEWSWLIGERYPANGIVTPDDPLMLSAIDARTGVQPSTGMTLQPADAGRGAHPANGHEWNIVDRDELQHACIFELPDPITCPSTDEVVAGAVLGCPCTWYEDAGYRNPLCETADGSFGLTQYFASATPGTRQLQLSHDVQSQAVVGSACAKLTGSARDDDGYLPSFAAILRRVQQRFAP
jgi:hypothetical protein